MSRMSNQALAGTRATFPSWLLIALGLAAIYLPSFIDLFQGAWSSEKNAHGPIVMAVAFCFLYFRVRQMLSQGLFVRAPAPLAGAALLVVGLLSYVLGRSQSVLLLEVGSLIFVLTGIVIGFFGVRTWSRMWFAFFFMLFMIPLPPSVVDVVTLPMKIGVSYATEHLLYWLGYPIARSGVILIIGQYQLLVADACAGLNSLFTLEALGLLYMNLVRHPSVVRNVVLACLIIPISFTANTIRIVFLALITYYFGDAAGQGFLHAFSGLVLFLSALFLIISIDGLLSWLVRRFGGADHSAAAGESGFQLPVVPAGAWQSIGELATRPAVLILVAMLATVGAAHALTPKVEHRQFAVALASHVPKQFGDWTEVPDLTSQANLATTDDGGNATDQLYDEVVMRTYANKQGQQIMLALAYAKEQRQDVKLHLPEICYPAQGYKVISLNQAALPVLAQGGSIVGKRMLASGNGRTEAVSYWTRIGHAYPMGGLAMRMQIFRDGLAGQVDDGILVRASSLVRDDSEAGAAYALQQQFLSQLVAVVHAPEQALVVAH
jgi:exosortase B